MNSAKIKALQERIGTEVDGFWGPKSTKAAQDHLRKMMPSPNPFPIQANVEKFYGPHGVKNGYTPPLKKIILPFTVYYEGSSVKTLSVHERCADSLLRVMERLAEEFDTTAKRRAAGILTWDGLYNPRKMMGGTIWSMHAWAIAIDFNAEFNGNFDHWPTKSEMPIEVMECFAKEGWTAAGAFWSRDSMHFQATKS